MTPSRLPSRFLPSLLFAVLLGGSLVSPGPALAQELPDWENPQVVGINKLDPHAPVYPFADPATARALDRANSPFYRLLNGQWKFKFSAHPGVRPLRFFETGFDDAAWDTIPVPANIEKRGYARRAHPRGRPLPSPGPHGRGLPERGALPPLRLQEHCRRSEAHPFSVADQITAIDDVHIDKWIDGLASEAFSRVLIPTNAPVSPTLIARVEQRLLARNRRVSEIAFVTDLSPS